MEVAAACGDSGVGNPHHYTETLYSRYEHGLKPIHIINRGESEKLYVVEDESKTRSFTSDRSLLMYLHDGYDPRITFDRYFRIGDHSNNQSPEVSGDCSVLGFFGGWGGAPGISICQDLLDRVEAKAKLGIAETTSSLKSSTDVWINPSDTNMDFPADSGSEETLTQPPRESPEITVAQVIDITTVLETKINSKKETLSSLRSALIFDDKPSIQIDPEVVHLPEIQIQKPQVALEELAVSAIPSVTGEPEIKLGIDLENRSLEVAKLMYAGFGGRIFKAGYDPEDVLQEIYKGLLARNIGRCPWDIRKSSFGHYVHMVIGCILSNYHRREQRRRGREQTGILTIYDNEVQFGDVASNETIEDEMDAYKTESEIQECIQSLDYWILRSEGDGHESKLARKILPWVREGRSRKEIAVYAGVSRSSIAKAITLLRRATLSWSGSAHRAEC